MKKKIILILGLVLILGVGLFVGIGMKDNFISEALSKVTNFGDKDKAKEEEVIDPATVDVTKLESYPYNELFKSGKYVLKYEGRLDLDPQDTRSNVTLAVDGENLLWIAEAEGSKIHVLTLGDQSYMIDDASKSYISGTMSNKESSVINGESLEYTGSGNEILYGKEMTYDEYKYDIGTLKYYFYKDELFAIKNDNPIESTVMNIVEFSADVTEDMFTLPSDYTGI